MDSSLNDYLFSVTAITDLVGDRIYPHHLPQGQNTFPVLTFQRISTSHDHTLTEAAGMCYARVQIDCWSKGSLNTALELAEAVRQALHGFRGDMEGTSVAFITLLNDGDMHEAPTDASDTWLYRRTQDWRIKYAETVPTPN